MKIFFPFFLLMIMSLNVTIPLLEQLRAEEDVCEWSEVGSEDGDGKEKTEKDNEKKIADCSYHLFFEMDADASLASQRSAFPKNEHPASDCYASMPELPPKVYTRI